MKKSLSDMVRSLGLMAVIVAAMLFIGARYLIIPGAADRMPAVDYLNVLQGFGQETHVPALAPHDLPTGWRANAARLSTPQPGVVQLHVGWATSDSRFAGLDEADGADSAVLTSVLGTSGLATHGTTTIGAATWDLRTSDRGERALTRRIGRLLVLVTGNATDPQLRMLAASLR